MGKRGQHYDDEFRRNAVDHWIRSRKSCQAVATDMGISVNSLRQWKKIYLSEPDGPQQQNLREEVDRLKRELQETREERDILKKSVAIFLKPRK
jgi:transposase